MMEHTWASHDATNVVFQRGKAITPTEMLRQPVGWGPATDLQAASLPVSKQRKAV